MKISGISKYNFGAGEQTYDLATFVAGQLDGDDYERGAVESAQATADNVAQAFGRLVDLLAERGLLSATDVTMLANCEHSFKNPTLHSND